ncbi:helix-turn-helix transcriptional regulator [Pararoseomonas sp. SCSIO 73927]|uniref:AraC family transcriptional regulator n=1 Tax=Pararoseomonas sp. SCSIO 73927 TaxID=3114537 RepID=UPI0030D53872
MASSFYSLQAGEPHGVVSALHVTVAAKAEEVPEHEHHSGQLIFALHGAVTCEVPGSLWIVPPDCAVWIPGGVRHSSRATANARMCFLFVRPEVTHLRDAPCTLAITPMVREMILHLAAQGIQAEEDAQTSRVVQALLGELERLTTTSYQLPVPGHPKLRRITDALTRDPSERSTLADWADRLATSERTLARLIEAETGMTFGRWRQQLQVLVALRGLASGLPVQQVSEVLGYGSVTAFITMFKRATGVTPARYFASRGP